MKANKLTLVRCLASKFSLICMLMLFGLTNAFAQGKQSSVLYLDAGDIVLGQENTFSLVLDNGATEVAGMNFNIVLPKGITFDEPNKENKFVANRTRLTKHHKLTIDPKAGVPGEYVITIFPSQVKTIKNNAQGEGKGEIAQLILKVDENFLDMDNKDIKLHSIAMSDATGKVKPFEDQLKGKEFAYAVRPLMGTLVGEQEAVSIYNGESATIGIALDNRNIVTSLQFDLHLPQGLTMDKDEDGDFVFIKSSRIPNHDFICKEHGNKISVVLHSMSGWKINGIENSNLFSFKVNAAKDFNAEGGEVVIDNIVMADGTGASYPTAAVVKVNVKNLTGDKVAVENKIAELKKALEAAEKHITENCADVKEAWLAAENAQKKAIVDRVAALEKKLAASVKDLTIAAEKETLLKDAAEIQALVEEYQKAADKAQADFVADKNKKAANEAAYKKLNEQLAGVQAELDAANKTVAEECKNVAAQFEETAAALQAQVEAKKAEVKKAYDEVALNAESVVDTKALSEAIAKMVTDAQAAQKAYDDEQAKLAANEAAYAKLSAELEALQTEVDKAEIQVATECKAVADSYKMDFFNLGKKVEGMVKDLKALYDKKELTAESTVDAAAVKAEIAELVAKAQEAQKAYEVEQAKLAANQAAFDRLNGVLAGVEKQIAEAKANVARDCKDVAAQFDAAFEEVNVALAAKKAEVKKAYDAEELTAESKVEVADVQAAMNKVVEDAKAAQKAFDEEQAKLSANEAAYNRLNSEIALVQMNLDAAKSTIARDYKDVAAQFDKAVAELQAQVDAMKAEVKKAYDAKELTAESKIDAAAVKAGVEKVLNDAAVAQKAFEAEQAKLAANEAANKRLNAAIADAQAQLDAAKASLAKDCKDVAAQFDKAVADLQAQLDKMVADVKKAYEAKELNAESTVATEGVKIAVANLLKDAQAAQKAFEAAVEANEAAYQRLQKDIAGVQKELDAVIDSIQKNYAIVADQFKGEKVQEMIDDLKANLEGLYDNVELNEESTVDTEAVQEAIEQLLADAKEAYIATGIGSIYADDAEVEGIYTLGGQRVNAPVKGWNIVKYVNGKSKKVYVK